MLDNLFECARTGKRRDVCGDKGCACRPLALEMLVGKQSLFDHFWGEGNENKLCVETLTPSGQLSGRESLWKTYSFFLQNNVASKKLKTFGESAAMKSIIVRSTKSQEKKKRGSIKDLLFFWKSSGLQ